MMKEYMEDLDTADLDTAGLDTADLDTAASDTVASAEVLGTLEDSAVRDLVASVLAVRDLASALDCHSSVD